MRIEIPLPPRRFTRKDGPIELGRAELPPSHQTPIFLEPILFAHAAAQSPTPHR